MSYIIYRKAIPQELLDRITEYKNLSTTIRVTDTTTYNDCVIFGKPVDDLQNVLWRKHSLYNLSNELAEEFSYHFFKNISLEGIYDYVSPILTNYIYLNVFRKDDFIKEHIDPPTPIWDELNLVRRANFSCMIDNNCEGGNLIVNGTKVESMERGDVVVFPQPLPHGVEPVTSGERFVVFGWIYDPGLPN
jgi:hypothetical protein